MHGVFDDTFRDIPSNIVKMQEVGIFARDFDDAVGNAQEFSNVTNQNAIPYWPLGPNSNSYASTFVESFTGSRPNPIVSAPGSDMGRPSSALPYSPAPASGGFLIYPNKPNTNFLQWVYAK